MQKLRSFLFLFVTFFLVAVFILGIIGLRNVLRDRPYTFTTSQQTVIKELRELQRLETASFTIEKVIDAGTSGNTFSQFLFGDRLLLIAQGEVIAGFDLSELSSDAVKVSEKSISITLPEPKILLTDLDNTATRVYDRRQGLLTNGDKNLESKAREEAENIITQAACEGGILVSASQNAKTQLTALFKTFGFENISISIPQGSC